MSRVMMMDETTKQLQAKSSVDLVEDTWIDWGTSFGQVSAGDMPLADAGTHFTTDDVEAALTELADLNFNTRKYIAGAITVAQNATRALIDLAGEVPTEFIANQSTTNTGVLLGASRIAVGALTVPSSGATLTIEDRRILGIVVDAGGDPVLMAGGQQVFFIYETKTAAGSVLNPSGTDSQIIFVYNDAGTYKAASFPGTGGSYYTWPVIRFDLLKTSGAGLPQDAMLYGGGGAEDLDNTPYSAGSGIAIDSGYVISLGTLTANWDVGSFDITAEQFHSDIAIGTAPFTVVSTTAVANLNADLLDGNHASAFATASHVHSGNDITSGVVAATVGGTGQTAVATGDVLYGSALNTWSRLSKGTNGHYLHLNASTGALEWSSVTGTLPSGAEGNTLYYTGGAWAVNTNILMTSTELNLLDAASFTVGTGKDLTIASDGTNVTMTALASVTLLSSGASGVVKLKAGSADVNSSIVITNVADSGLVEILATGKETFWIPTNVASAYRIISGGTDSMFVITTTTGAQTMSLGNATTNPAISLLGTGQKTINGNLDATGGVDVTVAPLTVGSPALFSVSNSTGNVTGTGEWNAAAVKLGYGGTGLTSYTAGDMVYYTSGTALSKLGIGTAYQVLRVNAGATAPEWTSEGSTVTTSVVAVAAGVTAKRLVAAHNDAGTGKLEDASAAAASTAFQVVGVALEAAAGGVGVKLQTSGVVTLTLPVTHAAVTAGDTAYLAQVAGGYVVMYSNIALTSTAYVVPVGVFLQTKVADAGGVVLVALGGVGAHANLIP